MKTKIKQLLTKGLLKENPVFVLMLGLCSVLAVSVSVINALGMTLAFTFVTVLSEVTISVLRKWIPKSLRIPIFIVIIASFVTILQFLLQAYFPSLNKALGIFIPLIVVNCIIIGRIESFASKKPVFDSILDGLGISLGYGIAILSIAIVREILGNGTILGYSLFGTSFEPALMFILPPGAFLVIGIEIGIINHVSKKASRKEASK
ncbi:MAG: electron transport complex subunit E [Caldisericia bacterium]|nr:electron transport complex subunit E [Caldisericia bacterium]